MRFLIFVIVTLGTLGFTGSAQAEIKQNYGPCSDLVLPVGQPTAANLALYAQCTGCANSYGTPTVSTNPPGFTCGNCPDGMTLQGNICSCGKAGFYYNGSQCALQMPKADPVPHQSNQSNDANCAWYYEWYLDFDTGIYSWQDWWEC